MMDQGFFTLPDQDLRTPEGMEEAAAAAAGYEAQADEYEQRQALQERHQRETAAARRELNTIINMMGDGTELPVIIAKAIDVIALFAHDPDWRAEALDELGQLCGDVEQLCLFRDEKDETEKRLKDRARRAHDREIADLRRAVKDQKQIYDTVTALLAKAENSDPV